jgi:Family of unknown function (DUF6152)
MARKFRVGWALGAAVCVIGGAAGAHHGTAAYDMSKLVTVVGTVTDFEFINPHSEVYFEVKDRAGKVEKWEAEAGSVTGMVRAGWKKSLLKPGDRQPSPGTSRRTDPTRCGCGRSCWLTGRSWRSNAGRITRIEFGGEWLETENERTGIPALMRYRVCLKRETKDRSLVFCTRSG